MQVRMLGSDTRIIKSGGDRINGSDLTVAVLAEVRLHAVEDPELSCGYRCRGFKCIDSSPGCLASDESDIFVLNEMIEASDRVRSAAHTCDDCIGKSAFLLKHLHLDLMTDNSLEITNDRGEGMRSHNRTEAVMRVVDPRSPLSHRLRNGVLKSCGSCLNRHNSCSEKLHAVNIECLTDGVLFAHEDDALHAHKRCCRSGSNSVLSGTGLGDQTGLAHLLRKERLPEHIVDLVRTCMVKVLTL